ncbi:MAG: septation regulator SpoVG [Bacillota bacterium]|nr:septation regulator SpoVG [Bacillota bacterium]
MKVTDVRLRRMQPSGKMRAYASVTLDDEFVVHEMRIIDGPRGLFVAMPSRRSADGEFRDIAHPITSEARQYIQTAVLEAFEQVAVQQAASAEAQVPG